MINDAVQLRHLFQAMGLLCWGLLAGCAGTDDLTAPVAANSNSAVSASAKVKPLNTLPPIPVNPPLRELSLATLPVTPLTPAHPWIQIGRYRVISALPTEAQQHLLQVIVNVTLPEEVASIQAAIQYLLAKSGYQFSTREASVEVMQLLHKGIPAVHRHLGPMTLETALQTLAGEPYQLMIDPVHRLVQVVLPAPVFTRNRRS